MSIEVDGFRTALLEERSRVEKAIATLRASHPGSIDDEVEEISGSSDNHLGDTATATLDREIDYTLEENSERLLSAIDGALERIEDGTFGTCRTCGRAIDPARLEALPYTTQCIDCKRKEERG